MGTRGAWGFRLNGEDKLAYNHFDSYPDGLGESLVKALRARMEPGDALDAMRGASATWLEKLRHDAAAIRLLQDDEKPTEADKERLAKYANIRTASQSLDDWYCLLRETQGDMEATLDAGVMDNALNFMADSLFCEWGYVINLDDELFEVYRGFQKEPHSEGRYSKLHMDSSRPKYSNEYYQVRLLAQYPLSDIPGDWVKRVERMVDAEDDD